jgi:hypothetical protein
MRTAGRVPWRLGILAAFAALAMSCEQVRVTAVEVASLTVDPSEGTVAPGDTLRLRATLRDASGNDLTNRPIEWRSEDPEVVRLEGEGLIRGMSPGTTTVRASSDGATGEASITVLTGPGIVLSLSRLTFEGVAGGDATSSRSVGISKQGPGILEGIEVSVIHPSGEPTGWLEATLAGTTAPTSVSVRADPSDLPAGTHRADVEVIASAAVNSPQVIEVTFEVEGAFPVVSLDPQAVGFAVAEGEGVPPPQVVSVTNSGGGELTDLEVSISYAEGQPTGWLDAELGGTTAPTELTLRVDPSGLESPAVFDAVVDVTSPVAESSGRVQVRFRLGEPPPEIDLDPTEIGWEIVEGDESPPTRAVAIENLGTGTLGGLSAAVVYGAGAAGGWLEVVVAPSFAPAVLTASLATTALLPGDYEATIRVLSNDAINSPQSVGVSLQVAPRASPETSSITASHGERVADGSSAALITVQLRDARGDAMPSGGDAVQLTTTLGTLSSVSDRGEGRYTATLTSKTSGTATITGTVNGDPIDDGATVRFVAGSPATVQIESGNNQTGTVGQTLGDPLRVRVVDAVGSPVSGVAVSWAPASGGGSANPTSSQTNSSGIASTTWTLGPSLGSQTLAASVSGVGSVTFNATAEGEDDDDEITLAIWAGDNQSGPAGEALPIELSVRVRYAEGPPLSGVTVSWEADEGSASPSSSQTASNGRATTTWTLGSSPGSQTLRASVTGVGSVTFNATAAAGGQDDHDDGTPCTEMEALLADLRAIEDANPGSDLADKLEDVRQEVEEAYYERCVKSPPDREAAAGNLEGAVDDMLDAIEDGLIGTSQGVGFLDRLLRVSRTMAIEAIEAAEARGGRQGDIERAKELVAEGDALHAAGEFEDAAETYTDAVSEAEGA